MKNQSWEDNENPQQFSHEIQTITYNVIDVNLFLRKLMRFLRKKGPNWCALYYYLNLDKKHLQKRHRIFRHDREPSRIPVRTLDHLSNKGRNVREFFYECICLSTPKSSKMHC